jgi:phosphopantothenoylcysteine decarboxylase/phosphopantothenate--cysteine ligase
MEFTKNHVLLAVSGGIAAYKAAEIVRQLAAAGVSVTVAMTKNAVRFIGPVTLEALSGNRVFTHEFDPAVPSEITHIGLGRDADLLLIAPATADLMARLAAGMADDLVATLALAYEGPQILCPAMNQRMWAHPATQANLKTLRARGWRVIEPEAGSLACGEIGPGRLADIGLIVAESLRELRKESRWAGKSVLVSAGPTWEPIDSVRHLSNRSSGKMGYALARAAHERGAWVTLVSGPTGIAPPPGVESIQVATAEEMFVALKKHFPATALTLMTAAVSDFKPAKPAKRKLHKGEGEATLALRKTPDLIALLAKGKKADQILCGFAAENRNEMLSSGREKLKNKKLDALFANAVEDGFGTATNGGVLLLADGKSVEFPVQDKNVLAGALLDSLADQFFRPVRKK